MKVAIVVESMFGNTETLATAVRDGLVDAGAEVRLVDVVDVRPEDLEGCELLVVAAPTHALTLSRPESRADAVAKGADPDRAATGVREWLPTLVPLLAGSTKPRVAVFDTKILKTKHWPGSAAYRAARTLRKEGFPVTTRRSFYVDGISGPLSPGELENARRWGRELAGQPA